MNTLPHSFNAKNIERPSPRLFWYYLLCAALTGPLSPLVILPLWFRYITLRYKFDDEGVSMRWGVFFQREIYLTYRRIQDIHLTANPLQRWMELPKISLQTASGSSQAEMQIEGILQADELRDYLYGRMRRDKHAVDTVTGTSGATHAIATGPSTSTEGIANEALVLLTEIRDALQTIEQRSRP
ncbi:MAG: PH domain-containing protein [Pirellulaceae bacterium]